MRTTGGIPAAVVGVIARGLQGHSDRHGRDLTADALRAVATRLEDRYGAPVSAVRYQGALAPVVDGLEIATAPPVFVPVRRRTRFGPWQEVQSVADAASEAAELLRHAA